MTSNKISRWWTSKTPQSITRALRVALQKKKWVNSKYRRNQWQKECLESDFD